MFQPLLFLLGAPIDTLDLTASLLSFLVGYSVTYFMTPLAARFAQRFGFMDEPGERRIHSAAIPRTGGIAVFAGLHASVLALYAMNWSDLPQGLLGVQWWSRFFVVSWVVLILGLLDDHKGLRPIAKLAGQIIAATLMFAGGVRVGGLFGIPFLPVVDYCVTVLWFLVIMNAFNLIDGFDGVATGLAAIAAAGIAGTFLYRQLYHETMILTGLVGACIGFLRFNFAPAKIFLGDSGSLFLGFTLASVILSTASKGTGMAAIWVPLLALGVPMFDTVLAIWRRTARKVVQRLLKIESKGGIMSGDLHHLHHRLMGMGLTPRNVTIMMYLASSSLVIVGLLGLLYRERALGIFAISFVIFVFVTIRYVARIELWQSGLVIVHGLGDHTRPALALTTYALLDIVGVMTAFFISVWFTHPYTTLFEVFSFWQQSLLSWCGIPLAILFLWECYQWIWRKNYAPGLTRHFMHWIAVFGVVLSLTLVRSSDGADIPVLQALVYFALIYIYFSATRQLPDAVITIMLKRLRRRAVAGKSPHTSGR